MRDDEPETKVLTDAALEAWPAAEPPAGFADRVLAARAAVPTPRRRRWPWIVAAGAAAAAVTAVALFLVAARPVERGRLEPRARTEARLGDRAVAVVEPGAALAWTVDRGGAARVEQARGDVFYRVEPGGPFVVATPAGEVAVRGTCFRVEVSEMKVGKEGLAGAAIGAAVTAVVMVTVYEGRVLLANEKGQTELRAGERATVASGGGPGPAVEARGAAGPPAPPGPPPPAGATGDELAAREAAQRQEIASLRARVAQLEAGAAATPAPGPGEEHRRPWKLRPGHDELVEMAKQCMVRFDLPGLEAEPYRLSRTLADKAGLSADEIAAAERTVDAVKARALAQIKAIYVEVTGNAAAAEDLSGDAMIREIEEKAGRAEALVAARQLSAERAGLVRVPAKLSARPPAERMLRVLSAVGDDTENELAKALGPDRAHTLRAANEGWSSKSSMSGCPSDGSDDGGR